MNESGLQPTTVVNMKVGEQTGNGIGGVTLVSEPDFDVTATTPTAETSLSAMVTMTSPTTTDMNTTTNHSSDSHNNTDVPYDLLLDDELNGFFDDEDAISTTTDEGRMSYFLDRKNTVCDDSGNAASADVAVSAVDTNRTRMNTTSGTSTADISEVGDTNNTQTVAVPTETPGNQQLEQEHDASSLSSSNNRLPLNQHHHTKRSDIHTTSSDFPSPVEHLPVQQPSPLPVASSTATKSYVNNASAVVVKRGNNSIVDELNLDDIVIDGVEPTLPWHSELFDSSHRQAMIRLIVTLLKARKKENPTRVWIIQLPIKARKLERRLYHSAASLAEYNDRTTLKQRLLDLVRVIAVQHHESRTFDNAVAQIQKQQPQGPPLFRSSFRASRGGGGSVTSQSSIESSSVLSQQQQMMLNRSSFVSTASIDSLRELRESVDAKATIESITSKIIPSSRSRANSVSSKRSATMGDENESALLEGTAFDKKLKESTDTFDMPAPRQRIRRTKASSGNSTTSRNNPNSRSNSFTTDSNAPIQPPPTTTEEHRQQQKSINQRLQEQISENIRLQEEIVRKLQQTDQHMLLTNSNLQSHNNSINTQQQQQYDPLSMYNMNANDFGANINNNFNLGGHDMLSPNAIMSSSPSVSTNAVNGLNVGLPNQLSFPQQQQQQQRQYGDYNNSLNPNVLLMQQQQQQQQPNFVQDNNNVRYNDVDSIRNQLLLQQQQQQNQQQQLLSLNGRSSQYQQNQYSARMQQQQLSSLPNLHGSLPGNNINLGMGQHQQQLIHNFSNNNNSFTQQQQVAMQMQLMNQNLPSSLSNISGNQQTQLQMMNALSENSSMSNIDPSSTGSTNASQHQPASEQPTSLYQPLDSNSTEPLDTLDWWK